MTQPTPRPPLKLPHGKLTVAQAREWFDRLEETAGERELFRQERRFLIALRRVRGIGRTGAVHASAASETARLRRLSTAGKRARAFKKKRRPAAPPSSADAIPSIATEVVDA